MSTTYVALFDFAVDFFQQEALLFQVEDYLLEVT
jgi:hypothetical protein